MVNNSFARERRAAPRRPLAPLLVAALCACAALAPDAPQAAAQSGRRKTDPARQSPAPTPTPEASPQGESESQPARGSKNASIVATFVVYEDESLELDFSITGSQRDIVSRSFFERLRQSSAVEVLAGGKGTRGQARERAKKESTAYAVHLELAEDLMTARDPRQQRDPLGRQRDASTYALRVSVYTPASADLKYSDLVQQRAYRPTARVGGIPVPVGRERVPGEYQLVQLARDAADRLLARFEIARPPDN